MDNPVAAWHERLWEWFVRHTAQRGALVWLGLLAFADALFFPLAPEIYLVAFALAQPAHWRRYLPVAIVTSTLGAAVGYYVGAFLFQQFGGPILAFYHLESAFRVAQHYIGGHVFWALLLASFTPIPDKVFIYASGFLAAPFWPFIAGYTIGRAARMALVVYLARAYGKRVLGLFQRYMLWFTAALLVLGTIYAMVHWHLLGL